MRRRQAPSRVLVGRAPMVLERVSIFAHLAAHCRGLSHEYGKGTALILGRLAQAAVTIEKDLAHAALFDRLGYTGDRNITGDLVKKLDQRAHDVVVSTLAATSVCAALISEESE